MMRRRYEIAAATFAGALTILAAVPVQAQQASTSAGSSSRPRSTDERVNTEAGTPPPVNSDYRRAAEGTLPGVPGGATPVAGGAIDPAARPLAGVGTLATANPAGLAPAPGFDAAMLIGHAVNMAIDGSTLACIAEANKPDGEGNDAVKALMAHAADETRASKELMTRAAAAGNSLDANSPVRRLYAAANNYVSTLATLTAPGGAASPNDKAQIATINHAVLAVMDADHLGQMGVGTTPAAPALAALAAHAQMMRDEGMKTIDRIAGTTPLDPSAPMTPIMLAARARDLVAAGAALGPIGRPAYGLGAPGMNGNYGTLPVPGRLQDTRPEIIGGTYDTGSQTAGTATGAEAAANVKNSTEGPGGVLNVPTPSGAPGSGPSGYGVGNNNTPPTNSTAGSRPR